MDPSVRASFESPPTYADTELGKYPQFVLTSDGFNALLSTIVEGAEPIEALLQVESAIDTIIQHLHNDKFLSGDFDYDLLADMLPTVVDHLIKRVNFTEVEREAASKVLLKMLDVIALHLQVISINYRLLKTLVLLFSFDTRKLFIHSHSGTGKNETWPDPFQAAARSGGPGYVSPYFIKNVQHFEAIGGFEVLLQKIERLHLGVHIASSDSTFTSESNNSRGIGGSQIDKDKNSPNQANLRLENGQKSQGDNTEDILAFETVQLLVTPFFLLTDLLNISFVKKNALRLRNIVFKQLLALPDSDVKTLFAKDVPQIIDSVIQYLNKGGFHKDAKNLWVLSHLETALRCLNQTSLEIRLLGLNRILMVMSQHFSLSTKPDEQPTGTGEPPATDGDSDKSKAPHSNRYHRYMGKVSSLLHNVEKGFSSESTPHIAVPAPVPQPGFSVSVSPPASVHTLTSPSESLQLSSPISSPPIATPNPTPIPTPHPTPHLASLSMPVMASGVRESKSTERIDLLNNNDKNHKPEDDLAPLLLSNTEYLGQDSTDKQAMVRALLAWMDANDLFGKLFDHIHAEIIRKAVPILSLFAKAGCVQRRHLAMLWSAADSQHHSVRVIVYEALRATVRYLKKADLEWLLTTYLMNMKASSCDQEDINFIKQFSILAHEAYPEKDPSSQHVPSPDAILIEEMYGMAILWDFITTKEICNDCGCDVANLALNSIVELVSTPALESFRMELLRRGIYAVDNHTSSPEHLEAMMKVLNTFPTGSKSGKKNQLSSLTKTVCLLEKKYNLLTTVISDLEYYKSKARAILNRKQVQKKKKFEAYGGDSPEISNEIINNTILTDDETGRPHLQQVKVRLRFLEFLLTQTPLVLHQEQVDKLWQLCMTETFTAQETWTFFSWCEHLMVGQSSGDQNYPDFTAFEDLVTEHLFVNKMKELEFDEINATSYRLFERFFYHVNAKKNKLAIQLQGEAPGLSSVSEGVQNIRATSSQYEIESYTFHDLVGLDSLWEIIVQAKSDEVGEIAIRTMLRQLQTLTNKKRRVIKAVREEFVMKCMNIIGPSVTDPDVETESIPLDLRNRRVNRALLLLEAFVEMIGDGRLGRCCSGTNQLSSASKSEIPPKQHAKPTEVVWRSRYSVRNWRAKKLPTEKPICVHIETDRQKPFDLQVHLTDTVKDLRYQCQRHFASILSSTLTEKEKVEMEFVLVTAGMKLRDDSQTLTALHFCEGQKIYVVFKETPGLLPTMSLISSLPLEHSTTITSNGSSASQSSRNATEDDDMDCIPTSMLSNPKYFDMLYRLLTWPSSITADRTLRLLRLLPFNADMLMAMCNVNPVTPDWKHIIPSTSEFQLLYSLQLVHHLFYLSSHRPPTSETQHAESTQASPKNAKLVGLKHKIDSSSIILLRKSGSDLSAEDSTKGSLEFSRWGWNKRANISGAPETYKIPPQVLLQIQQKSGEFVKIFVNKGGIEYLITLFDTMAQGLTDLSCNMKNCAERRKSHSTGNERSETQLREEVLISCVHLLSDLLCHMCLESRATKDDTPDINFTGKAIHTMIPLVFNILKLPPSFLEADTTAVNPPFLCEHIITILAPRPEMIPLLVKSIMTTTSVIIQTCAWMDELNDESVQAILDHVNKRDSIRLLLCILERYPNIIKDDQLQEWLRLLFLQNNQVVFREQVLAIFESFYRKRLSGSPYTVRPIFAAIGVRIENGMTQLLATAISFPKKCTQYFVALAQLISVADVENDKNARNRYWKTALEAAKLIKRHSVKPMDPAALIQLIKLLTVLLAKMPDIKTVLGDPTRYGMVECLMNDFLLLTSDSLARGLRVSGDDVRAVAFLCLAELVLHCETNLSQLIEMISTQLKLVKPSKGWDNTSWDLRRVNRGYVGLKNMGATCYVNSLIQQLFMIPDLRSQLLSVNINSGDPAISGMFFNLQAVFSYLQESERRYYNPMDFLTAFRDHDNQPIDVALQMDVSEFFNVLMDQLERGLKCVKKTHALDHVFGGTFASQVLSDECDHVSETKEPFFFMSLDVKTNQNVVSSLESLIQADLLDGDNKYYCEQCKRYIRARRRCVLGDLPNTLVLHLKRFDFNFTTLKQSKLNSRYEFPMDLNLLPYSKAYLKNRERPTSPTSSTDSVSMEDIDNLSTESVNMKYEDESKPGPVDPSEILQAPGYYDYTLKGVIVHQGTSERGHYYSLIKERVPALGSKECSWFKFNDTEVIPFDPESIPNECFGGAIAEAQTSLPKGPSSSQSLVTDDSCTRLKSHNAYLLIYDRKYPEMADAHRNFQDERWPQKMADEEAEAKQMQNKVGTQEKEEVIKDQLVQTAQGPVISVMSPTSIRSDLPFKNTLLLKDIEIDNSQSEPDNIVTMLTPVEEPLKPLTATNVPSLPNGNNVKEKDMTLDQSSMGNLDLGKHDNRLETVHDAIQQDNIMLLRKAQLFDHSLSGFLFDVMWGILWGMKSHPLNTEVLEQFSKLVTQFVVSIVARSRHRHKVFIDDWFVNLKKLYSLCPMTVKWLIKYLDQATAQDLLINCPDPVLSNAFSDLLAHCLELIPENQDSWQPLMDKLVNTKNGEQLHYGTNTQAYYRILLRFAQMGDYQRFYLLQKGVIRQLSQVIKRQQDSGPDRVNLTSSIQSAPMNIPLPTAANPLGVIGFTDTTSVATTHSMDLATPRVQSQSMNTPDSFGSIRNKLFSSHSIRRSHPTVEPPSPSSGICIYGLLCPGNTQLNRPNLVETVHIRINEPTIQQASYTSCVELLRTLVCTCDMGSSRKCVLAISPVHPCVDIDNMSADEVLVGNLLFSGLAVKPSLDILTMLCWENLDNSRDIINAFHDGALLLKNDTVLTIGLTIFHALICINDRQFTWRLGYGLSILLQLIAAHPKSAKGEKLAKHLFARAGQIRDIDDWIHKPSNKKIIDSLFKANGWESYQSSSNKTSS